MTAGSGRRAADFVGRLLSDCGRALRQSGQWRLLLLWLLGLALPLLLGLLPLWLTLSALLGRSLQGSALAEGFDVTAFVETLRGLGPAGWAPASGLGGLVVYGLLLPWLAGVTLAAARSPRRLGLGGLLQAGVAEYGRMARLGLWSLLPLALLAAAGGGLVYGARQLALKLTLRADADHLGQAAMALAALLLWLGLASVEAARAQLVIEPRRRSVVLAWWRGTRGLLRRPSRLAGYLLLTAGGALLAALLGWLRIQVVAGNALGLLAALLLGQALVAVLAWMRCARLFALVASGRG